MTDNTPPPQSVSGQRRRRRVRRGWRSRFVWVVTTGLLFSITLPAWVLLTDYRGKRAVRQIKQAVSERGITVSVPDEPVAFDNGVRWYLAAAAAVAFDEKYRPVAPAFGNAEWPLFGEAISDPQRDVLRRLVEPNVAAMGLVRRADEHRRFSYGWHVTRPLDVVSDEIGTLRRLMRWFTLRSDLAWSEGDQTDAVWWAIAGLRLGDRVAPTDGALHHLAVKNAGLSIGRGQLEMLLSRGKIGVSQLLAAEQALSRSHTDLRLVPMLERLAADAVVTSSDADQMSLHAMAAAHAGQNIARDIATGFGANPDDLQPSRLETAKYRVGYAWSLLNPGRGQILTRRELTAYLQVLDLIRAGSTTDTIEAAVEPLLDEGLDMMAGLPVQQRTHRMLRAELQTAVWGFRAERYSLTSERWPRDMNELVAFAEADGALSVPVDPWGQSLRLSRTDDGLRVYSVGADGTDHGGFDPWDDFPDPTVRPDDTNFRLLDPELRGRPTTVTELVGEPPPSLQETMEELRETVEEFKGSQSKE